MIGEIWGIWGLQTYILIKNSNFGLTKKKKKKKCTIGVMSERVVSEAEATLRAKYLDLVVKSQGWPKPGEKPVTQDDFTVIAKEFVAVYPDSELTIQWAQPYLEKIDKPAET